MVQITTLLTLLVQFSPQDFGYQRSRWSTELLAMQIKTLFSAAVAASTIRHGYPGLGLSGAVRLGMPSVIAYLHPIQGVGFRYSTHRITSYNVCYTKLLRMPEVYREVRKATVPARDGVVTLDIIVDTTSIEVFVNDGEVVLSDLVFGAPGANNLSVASFGGDTELRFFQLSPLKVAPIKRYGGDAL